MNGPYVEPLLQRTLSAVYRFYDAFFFPIDERTPPVASPLEVSIPPTGWTALHGDNDLTYRFSASTLSQPAPTGANLPVEVVARNGDYVSFEPILLSLPLAVSIPPQRADFLIVKPLWPTPALRPPDGETAVRGFIRSATAQPVADLKIEMWLGGAPVPPPGTPYTRSNADGDFLFRFPLLKGVPGAVVPVGIQLADGAVAVTPAAPSIALGRTQIIAFQRP